MTEPLSLLRQREIEARVIAPLYRAFAAEIGEERAQAIIGQTIQQLAEQAGCDAAVALGGCELHHLRQVVDRWQEGKALELVVLQDDAEQLNFNVTRCQYAELYQKLGISELGPLLSCNRDAAMIAGFNPDIDYQRTQTIMGGASHCDFRYRKRKPLPE
ncbi:MAG: L-2-amino-thiazoline-4-carboxylic acid hydrolase [Bacteroidales bacterium]|nr:L-2-amino-thiazoline-4-carboxylic acid hydrolase [Bacteroidales bacterium]